MEKKMEKGVRMCVGWTVHFYVCCLFVLVPLHM